MQGLMQQYPLTLATVFRRAEQLWPTRAVVTAGALDQLGVLADGRLGPFAWNSARHLENDLMGHPKVSLCERFADVMAEDAR